MALIKLLSTIFSSKFKKNPLKQQVEYESTCGNGLKN